MRPAYLALLTSLAVAGCVAPPTSSQRLSESAYDFNTAMRFGRMDIAAEHVREIAREEFNKKHAGWGKSVRVVDLEMSGISMRKDGDADVLVTVSWQWAADTTMRTTDLTQRWTSTHGTWSMISEEEHSGDKGVIGELEKPKTDDAAPAAPRPRYQTHVIYEQ
jgi:hypothetical protein